MEVNMGGKIRQLRKQKNISQEVMAQALGVSFQAVSKWETCAAMPDVAMIPAIASFFGVSTDELFDFNLIDQEKKSAGSVLDCRGIPLHRPEEVRNDAAGGAPAVPGQ